ncbi:hypothetical protein KKA24_01380 [Patescibacteria group bacterium]|nr:hypothetical protein [Patescibacteria group bacterium]
MNAETKKSNVSEVRESIFYGAFLVFLTLCLAGLNGCVSHVAWTTGAGKEGITEAGQMVARRGPGVDYPHDSADIQLDNKVQVGRSAQAD